MWSRSPAVSALLATALLALAAPSCRTSVPVAARGPTEAAGGPGGRPRRAVPAAVVLARQRLRAHDLEGALALLGGAPPPAGPAPSEAAWLEAYVYASVGLDVEARRYAATLPPGRFRTALLASLSEEPERALRDLEATFGDPPDPWTRLAAAWLSAELGDDDGAARRATEALGRGWAYVDVEARLVRARVFAAEGDLDAARREAAAAHAIEGTDVRPLVLEAEVARRADEIERAVDAWAAAMRLAPTNEGLPLAAARLLRRFPDPALAARLERALAGVGPATPEHEALRALLAARRGDLATASQEAEDALARGASPVALSRDLRRWRAARGDFAGAVRLLVDAVPPWVRTAPGSLVRDAWHEVESSVRSAPDRRAPDAARIALARSLVAVGALPEARSVLLGVASPTARSLDAHLGAHLAFEDALEAAIEKGFVKGHRKERAPALEQLLHVMTTLAEAHLPPDEARAFEPPYVGLRRIPLLGSWLDHGARSASPIVRHFRRYGRFLVLGQRGDDPPEAILLSVAALTPAAEVHTRGGTYRQDVAFGYDRRLASWQDAKGDGLAGASLPDGVWIDVDAAREAEHDLRRALTLDPSRTRRVEHAETRLPPDGPGGLLGLSSPQGVAERVLARYVARRPTERWGSLGTLTAHELGHVVEIRRHLPILPRLPATLALLAREGFDPKQVEMELERRAQLAAVAESPDPDLALAEMLAELPVRTRDPEVHAGGYRLGVAGIVSEVWLRPDRYPEIDRQYRVLPQLDRLRPEEVRRAARAALGLPDRP